MAYNGDYLVARTDRTGPLGNRVWDYDTTDTHTDIGVSGYITDAAFSNGTTAKEGKKGLRKGDRIYVRRWSALPTDALADMVSPAATLPTLTSVAEYIVAGIVAATGVADLALLNHTVIASANID